jgi:hypothetical protein
MRQVLVLAFVLGTPVAAWAGDGDHALSLALGYGTASVVQTTDANTQERRTMHGGALILDYDKGFGDAWGFRIAASAGLGDGPGTGVAWNGSATFGLRYALDVLRYVPYVHGGIGVMMLGGGGLERTARPIVELGGGLEVLESTTWSWGIAVRVETLGTDTVFFTVTPRISYRWGYF